MATLVNQRTMKMKEGKSQRPISFVVPPALHEAIERAADGEMISISSFCRRAALHAVLETGFLSPQREAEHA